MVLSKKSFWESEQKFKKNANVQIYKTWESQYIDMYLKQEIWSVIWNKTALNWALTNGGKWDGFTKGSFQS